MSLRIFPKIWCSKVARESAPVCIKQAAEVKWKYMNVDNAKVINTIYIQVTEIKINNLLRLISQSTKFDTLMHQLQSALSITLRRKSLLIE
ncbi:MAG: hypothetical protein V7K38_13380 [Nostoc sp.]|uniref:hypothetical protein n=1 Tax=Nostoc sp. TaxID=1180 RepID=UPI002FFADB48